MEKILLAGKFNAELEELIQSLGNFFKVQLSGDNFELFRNNVRIFKPSMVIISLIGLKEEHQKLFRWMKENEGDIPVMAIGTKGEQHNFRSQLSHSVVVVDRPVNHGNVIIRINRILQAGINEADVVALREKKTQKQILVVDRESEQRGWLEQLLAQAHYQVMAVESGREAIGYLGKSLPDLIILEYELPGADGRQTLQMLREIDEARDIPVIFYTGVNQISRIQAIIGLHPVAYLLKPSTKETILHTVQNIIGR